MKRKPLEPGKYFCFFFSVIFISCVLTGCGRRDDLFQESSQEMADEEEFQITDQETANTQVPVSEAAITESAVLAEVSQEPEEIYVDVSGAVVSPGVYCLDAGSRIFQAIEAAGGCTTEAAPVCLNQAAELSDGQKVYVPTVQGSRRCGSWKWRGWQCRKFMGSGYTVICNRTDVRGYRTGIRGHPVQGRLILIQQTKSC